MIFTLYYMYATLLQWWRLGSLKNKLNGTLNINNALLVCDESVILETKNTKSFENLLFRKGKRIGCTVVPKQRINLSSHWVIFPRDLKYFPMFFKQNKVPINSPSIYILCQAVLDTYKKHQAEILQMENFGVLIAWRISDNFEAILKTDMDKLTKLVHCFSQTDCDINHELQLLKIETVDVEGKAKRIKFERQFSMDSTLKYSLAPVHWSRFVSDMKDIYSKIWDATNPKITIDNGTPKPEDLKKVPVSEVRPIKKDKKPVDDKDKHTLDVNSSDYRRHKAEHSKKEKEKSLHKPEKDKSSKKELSTTKEDKPREEHHKSREHKKYSKSKDDADSSKHHKKDKEAKTDSKNGLERDEISHLKEETTSKSETAEYSKSKDDADSSKHHKKDKDAKTDSKNGLERDEMSNFKKETTSKSETAVKKSEREAKSESGKEKKGHKKEEKHKASSKTQEVDKQPSTSNEQRVPEKLKQEDRTSSKEKKLLRGTATWCDDGFNFVDGDLDDGNISPTTSKESQLETSDLADAQNGTKMEEHPDVPSPSDSIECSIDRNVLKQVKPPNILVYADSTAAKEKVKEVLSTILNKDKYLIYDLPVTGRTTWIDSTALVVVCGTVEPNLTSNLMKYLLRGGQLLCLCSDFLYSVLHTFTTAEVREHELVRFSYGKWKNVKMMHHIFCYQASPAKKQFSKDSDASNTSGNGSSPIAPRTPSAVEIQHGGKDYTVQVQVLGAEETWQTPSLLLATVKGAEGRAIFSQVHLEIDPDEFVEDETKFEALTGSNQARLEILNDILANHLSLDCDNSNVIPELTPVYLLGRHDLKFSMIHDNCGVVDKEVRAGDMRVRFCGRNDPYDDSNSEITCVLTDACPKNFNTVSYFEALDTQYIGRLLIYSDVLASTHSLLPTTQLQHGLAVVCRQQIGGIGRADNKWLSPPGSLSFSLQLHTPSITNLGKHLTLVQHLQMVAVVKAVKKLTGNNKHIKIGIKWPNDLYVNGCVKVGGLIVTAVSKGDSTLVNIGCGINLSNPNPTTSINQIIRKVNKKRWFNIPELKYEKFLAHIFNETENLFRRFQGGDVEYFFDNYYEHWLHTDSMVTITSKEGKSEKGKIVGIDNYGFLKVRISDGTISSVQPDGNSFDMMKGLIYPKSL